ncbi:MAG: CpsD/CapB family tyrosine-protein kinase [Myxococcota bacterium]
MGKVFDALRRAEEERKAASAGAAGIPPGPAGSAIPESRPAPEAPVVRADAPPHAAPPRRRRAIGGRALGIRGAFRTAWRWVRNRGRLEVDAGLADVKRRIIQFDPYSPAAEQYRGIRTRVELLNENGECRVLALISALPDEGKTMTSINLALVMGMSVGKRVLLVDCDLRTPRVHSTLDVAVEAGLSEVLRGESELDRALYKIPGENLTVLPAGTVPTNPAELLATPRMRETLEQLRENFDHVILDTPPALHVADAEIICNLVDGIIFVVRAGSTPREQVQRALENFDRERIVGMVLNSAEDLEPGDYEGES